MIIVAVGDTLGALERMYADILTFEDMLSVRFAWVLHVGDFGIWPDPERVDRATRRHDGAGNFQSTPRAILPEERSRSGTTGR